MVNRIAKILFAIAALFYVFHFLFFWIFETTDSWFYWALGNYIKTGIYNAPHPYYYTVPSTHEPPLYSLFLYLVQFVNRADVVIHFFHICLLFLSAYFLYRILCGYLRSNLSFLITGIYLFIPAHFTYVSALMTEIPALFATSLYLYICHFIISEKKRDWLKFLILLSSVMVLLKYSFIIFFCAAVFLFVISKRKQSVDFFYLIVGVVIIAVWVLINHALNGSWGLSGSTGKHLYNRVVDFDHLLPDENDPSLTKLRKYTGDANLYSPWWLLEPMMITKLEDGESEVSRIMGNVVFAALAKNPLPYIYNTPKMFLAIHGSDTNNYFLSNYTAKSCRNLGTIYFCKPIIESREKFIYWDAIASISDFYSRKIVPYLHYFLLFPALVFAVLKGNRFLKFCAFVYLISTTVAVMTEVPAGRYLYAFIPIMIILLTYFLTHLCRLIQRKFLPFNLFKT